MAKRQTAGHGFVVLKSDTTMSSGSKGAAMRHWGSRTTGSLSQRTSEEEGATVAMVATASEGHVFALHHQDGHACRLTDPSPLTRTSQKLKHKGAIMTYAFHNLIFEGGGVKGIAYVGALGVLAEKDIIPAIQRIGGTSAGAINAILLGLGFTQKETKDILWSLDFNKFMDDSWGIMRDTERLIQQFGWYKGDYFRNWIGKLIKEKTGNSESTFSDIEAMKDKRGFKSLYFMGTNLATSFSEVFSAEHTPRFCVADAVRISMSIPLFFAAKRSFRGDVYVDGGLLDNYPVKLFDRERYLQSSNFTEPDYYKKINLQFGGSDRPISRYVYNKETLGFRLDTKEEISVFRDHAEPAHKDIDNFFDYTWALIRTVLEAQQSSHLHNDDWARTVYIDTLGVGTTDFDLSDTKKKELVKSGRDNALKYFEWYDNPQPKPNK
jgi:NTE family protein